MQQEEVEEKRKAGVDQEDTSRGHERAGRTQMHKERRIRGISKGKREYVAASGGKQQRREIKGDKKNLLQVD